ncbi:MAG: glycohydrolase toxin TNT-related protein [Nocardioidaceae bacterium]
MQPPQQGSRHTVTFKNRGLPSSRAGDPYSSFTVRKPITVRGGLAAPWMDSHPTMPWRSWTSCTTRR